MTRTFRMSSDTSYVVCDLCGKSQNLTEDEAERAGWLAMTCVTDYCPECAS